MCATGVGKPTLRNRRFWPRLWPFFEPPKSPAVCFPSDFERSRKCLRSVSPVRARELPHLARLLRPVRATAQQKSVTSRSRFRLQCPSAEWSPSPVISPSRTADLGVSHRMRIGKCRLGPLFRSDHGAFGRYNGPLPTREKGRFFVTDWQFADRLREGHGSGPVTMITRSATATTGSICRTQTCRCCASFRSRKGNVEMKMNRKGSSHKCVPGPVNS